MSIVNESTSIVQVDSSGLQNGQVNIVYISTSAIPGQLVSVIDATGYTSSPQAILISTTGGAQFKDGSYSTSIAQRFGYLTLTTDGVRTWSFVNTSAFPQSSNSSVYKGLDTGTVATYVANASLYISSSGVGTMRSLTADARLTGTEDFFTSTLYINGFSSFLASKPNDYRMTLIGNEYISGPLVVTGSASYRGPLSITGDLFTRGNISSKQGTIYVEGDVIAGGSIRGQRGLSMIASGLSTFSTANFSGALRLGNILTSGTTVTANSISSPLTTAVTMNIASSIGFSNPLKAIVNTVPTLDIVGLSMTVPSTISTSWLSALQSITTSNLVLQSFGTASTLAYLRLGSTSITNDAGTLVTSSIQANSILARQGLTAPAVQNATTLTTAGITMNTSDPNGQFSILFPDGIHTIPRYWSISSIGTNGSLAAPYMTLSTLTIFTKSGAADQLDTSNDVVTNFTSGNVIVSSSVYMNGLTRASLNGVFVNNSLGTILASTAETTQSVHCSSIITDHISTGAAVRFIQPIRATLQDSFISTVTANTMNTSSLHTTRIVTGRQELYSTINPSTPWLLTSSFQMNTGPFMATHGLGTYFEQATFIASQNAITYYSIVNPLAQEKTYLSTPYVNTVFSGGTILTQPTSDTLGAAYVGVKELGWKLKKIDLSGAITTIAGNYRYFYGDGRFPLNAAFGPRLAVSMSGGLPLITDISNVRLRAITVDPVVTTIAGTGDSSYTGDGGLAYYATFSTPSMTVTDNSGVIYVADRGNQIIRRIVASTITTFAGTPNLPGNTGDGGPATAAKLNQPFGLAVNSSNRVYVTDLSNCVIRSIDLLGNISLVAGTYVNGYGGDGAAATSATLSYPRGIAVDLNNNIYFCDTGNARVRCIDAITQTIRTVAGNGVAAYGGDGGLAVNASLSTPTGVTTDLVGNLYIADTDNQCIRYVNMANQRIATVAGRPRLSGNTGDTSFARFALMSNPSHVVFDRNSGYYYIADDGNARIRYVDPSMGIIYGAAGNGSPVYTGDGGPSENAVFGSITSLTADTSNIYIADAVGHTIRAINLSTGIIRAIAGTGVAGFSGDGSSSLTANLSSPNTVVVDSASNLYFTDTENQRIRTITANGIISTIAGTGNAEYNGDNISSSRASLNYPRALALSAGSLYVGDTNNYRIRKLGTSPSSVITTYLGSGFSGSPTSNVPFLRVLLGTTTAITFDSTSQLAFTDATTSGIWSMSTGSGTLTALSGISTSAYLGDAGPLSNAYFASPAGISVDNQGNFLIADSGNRRLRRTYTFGYPQTPTYLTMNFTYTNYYASTGTSYIALNGNVLKTFDGTTGSNDTFQINTTNIVNYPLQGSNPVSGDQTPFIEITQTNTYGYTKLSGNLFVEQVASQGLLRNSVNSNAGIVMNSGVLSFPNKNEGITMNNQLNDASLRSVFYTGSLFNASDPALKEEIENASTSLCYSTLQSTPLKRYRYTEAYVSTFHVDDRHRLGFLTSDITPTFPKSVGSVSYEHAWAPPIVHTLDAAQIKMNHYGVTQHLMGIVSTLESEVAECTRIILAQRNSHL